MVSSYLSFTPGFKAARSSRYPHSLSEKGRNPAYLKSEEELSEMSREPHMSSAKIGSSVVSKGNPEP